MCVGRDGTELIALIFFFFLHIKCITPVNLQRLSFFHFVVALKARSIHRAIHSIEPWRESAEKQVRRVDRGQSSQSPASGRFDPN